LKKAHIFLKTVSMWIGAACLILLLNFGCAEKKGIKPDLAFEKWRAMAKTSKGHSPSAERHERLSEQRPGTTDEKKIVPSVERKLPSKKITMKLQDTNVSTILRALARSVDLNILINENVKSKTNIHVKDARWDQLFKGILRSNGLAYVWEGDLLRVMTLEDMERDLKSTEQKRDMKLTEPLVTRIIPIKYADEKKLSENLVKFLLKNKKGNSIGSVLVDAHTKSLVIQALPYDMERLISLVEKLDQPISQVLIEANIVETGRETARELGIQWGGLARGAGTTNQYITSGANSSGVLGSNLDAAISPTSGMAVNFPADLGNSGGLTIGYVAERLGDNVLALQLSALQREGKLNILSSPSITTLDNQSAVIESGSTVPYQTVSSNGDINIEWKDAVLRLEVEPHVINDTTLKLAIKTRKDELDFSREVQGNPYIITKKAETSIFLFDGQTTVIGGLNKEKNSDSETGVPWLMNMPFIGHLFKGTSHDNTMEDVLIFITPHILKKEKTVEPEISVSSSPEVLSSPNIPEDDSSEATSLLPANQDFGNKEMPVILGRVAAEKQETLWMLIQSVYGYYNQNVMEDVLEINPHIKDPDNIAIGQFIYFPPVERTPKSPSQSECWWVKIDEKDTLENALRQLRAYKNLFPKVRIIPHWNSRDGLRFFIILKEYFFSENQANQTIKNLPDSIQPGVIIISSWDERTVFFADPYLAFEEK